MPRSRTLPVVLAAALLPLAGCRPPAASHAPEPGAPAPSAAAVEARLAARIAQVPGAQVAIAVHDLASGRRLSMRGDSVYHAASTMKVPVLMALYQEFRAGRLRPDQRVPLANRFASIVDGSPYALTASEDSDSLVYAWVGGTVPVRDLAVRMITHSSNLATNALIQLLDPVRITQQLRGWGATTMVVRRGVEDNLAFRAGLNNTATANDLVALFSALAQGRVADRAATQDMLGILEAQHFNEEIPAGLPPGTRVAHKTGWITATQHDAGLVYPSGRAPYAIAILTRGITDTNVGNALMADCSRIVWQWLVEGR
jgi:beta-lactamase class A